MYTLWERSPDLRVTAFPGLARNKVCNVQILGVSEGLGEEMTR